MSPSSRPTGPRRRFDGLGWWWVALGLALGYAAMRLTMNEEYRVAPWRSLLELRAPLPFGHRVLMPLLARPLVELGLPIRLVWGIGEALAVLGLMVAVRWTLRPTLGPRGAKAAAVGLVLLLPWLFLVPHRWSIFYPWDTPAMALLIVGIGAIDRRRWGWALLIAGVAALNRESAIMLPAIALGLDPPQGSRWREAMAPAMGLVAVVLAVRLAVMVALPGNPGPPLHFTVQGHYRVLHNLHWLAHPVHALMTIPSLGAWPLIWPCLARWVDARWRRMWQWAWLQTAGLMVVANIYEPRAFGEVLALSYIPTAMGLARWLQGNPAALSDRSGSGSGWVGWLDRHGWWVVILCFAGFVVALDQWSFLPVAQWPMPKPKGG